MKFYSQLGQDRNVLQYYKNKTDGFFVEVGAWDGIELSNTYALEKHGWKGVCVEPLPQRYEALVKNRSCKCYNVAVDMESGKELEFVVAEMLSGDLQRLDKERVAREYGLSKRIPVKTLNFTDLLNDANAPQFIDFLSLDTEGSEYDILKGLDFQKYTFGYISVEHNYKEPTRSNIRQLLESYGYTFRAQNKWDDDYVFLK